MPGSGWPRAFRGAEEAMNRNSGEQPASQMQAQIAELSSQISDIEDPRQGWAMVRAQMEEYRRAGWAIPDDLAVIERQLQTECMLASQGR